VSGASATDELDLIGWDVVAVGRRQAWLFVTFAAPSSERTERTLWIDTTFRVRLATGGETVGVPVSGTGLADLEPLVTAFVEDVVLDKDRLALRFDNGSTLQVENAPEAAESSMWWLSPHAAG
jgi:hypothetical protein